MSHARFALLAAGCAALASSLASAGVVNHQWSGAFSGTFAGMSFTDRLITFTATVETANRTEVDGSPFRVYQNAHLGPTTVDIDGYGIYAMIFPTCSYADELGAIGLARLSGEDYFGVNYGALGSEWDMQVSIGPVVSSTWSIGSLSSIETNGGFLNLTANSTPVSFVGGVPAPGALALLGLAGLAGRRRR